jgi:putative hydrolase of the HAD superfamily
MRPASSGSVRPMTRPNPDVDAVIFDFVGVLSTSPGDMMRRQIEVDGFSGEIDIASFVQILMGPLAEEGAHPWHHLERGRIEFDEYVAGIEPLWRAAGYESFPTPPRGADLLSAMSRVPEMIDAARAVRTAGYRTAILTNNIKEWSSWRQTWDADNLVDVVVDSCEVDMRKPNADIFELTVDRLGTSMQRTLFLDDFPWNIAGAEAVGLQTMLVTDPVAAAAALLERLL